MSTAFSCGSQPKALSEDEARSLLEGLRWYRGRITCPRCGSRKITRFAQGGQSGMLMCNKCRRKFSVRTGTILAQSHIPLRAWVQATRLLHLKPKMSTSELMKQVGIRTRKSALKLRKTIDRKFAPYTSKRVHLIRLVDSKRQMHAGVHKDDENQKSSDRRQAAEDKLREYVKGHLAKLIGDFKIPMKVDLVDSFIYQGERTFLDAIMDATVVYEAVGISWFSRQEIDEIVKHAEVLDNLLISVRGAPAATLMKIRIAVERFAACFAGPFREGTARRLNLRREAFEHSVWRMREAIPGYRSRISSE